MEDERVNPICVVKQTQSMQSVN